MPPPTRILQDEETHTRQSRGLQAEIMEKDETELRLEKTLFGDEADFLGSLETSTANYDLGLPRIAPAKEMVVSGEDLNMTDVPDDDLFFLDTSTTTLPHLLAQHMKVDDQELAEDKRYSAWIDSDDERIAISLVSNPRLRKLRDTEEDDVVTGTEYIRRLRRQYERLHPTPNWVKYAYKKRKLSKEKTASDSDSDSDISIDDDNSLSSVQPLSELLRSTGGLVRSDTSTNHGKRLRKLRPEVIDIQRVKDIAASGPSSIDTMQFHPYFPLILTGGPSSTVNLYHISPQPPNPNPLITSLHLKNTPLHTAAFCRPDVSETGPDDGTDGTRIFLSSRRRYFHTWSLTTGKIQKVSRPVYGSGRKEQKTMEHFKLSPCGRYMGLVGSGKKGGGVINVLSTRTMQWICACRIDSRGGVADYSWWRHGNGFTAIGKNGEANEYDIDQKRVVCRWLDEGAVGTTVIALGGHIEKTGLGGNRWVAVGSSSGIVNIYDRREWSNGSDNELKAPQRPKPLKVFDQLTTPISHIEFSDDGQMMVMGSRWKKNALKLVHLPSCTVYRNWPTDKTPLGRVSSIALSMDGGYLAVANEQGKVRLFQIRD